MGSVNVTTILTFLGALLLPSQYIQMKVSEMVAFSPFSWEITSCIIGIVLLTVACYTPKYRKKTNYNNSSYRR
ncbi:hypothetical protein [Methanococcus sp. CF]